MLQFDGAKEDLLLLSRMPATLKMHSTGTLPGLIERKTCAGGVRLGNLEWRVFQNVMESSNDDSAK